MLETIFGDGFRATVSVAGLKVQLKTLSVNDVSSTLERTQQITESIYRAHEQQTLTVAFSLESVDGNPMPEGIEERIKLVRSWPKAIIDKLNLAYSELYVRQLRGLDELKNA